MYCKAPDGPLPTPYGLGYRLQVPEVPAADVRIMSTSRRLLVWCSSCTISLKRFATLLSSDKLDDTLLTVVGVNESVAQRQCHSIWRWFPPRAISSATSDHNPQAQHLIACAGATVIPALMPAIAYDRAHGRRNALANR